MEDDRCLGIVPKGASEDAGASFLLFENDRMLSLTLSEAITLAADHKVANLTILSQLGK